jgi:hypothetical protein
LLRQIKRTSELEEMFELQKPISLIHIPKTTITATPEKPKRMGRPKKIVIQAD